MSDPASSIPGGHPLRPVGEVGQGTGQASSCDSSHSALFKTLLESLERKAEALGEKSRSELQPAELSEAVDEARSSFEDALALQDRLLEAWRQSRLERPSTGVQPGGDARGRSGA